MRDGQSWPGWPLDSVGAQVEAGKPAVVQAGIKRCWCAHSDTAQAALPLFTASEGPGMSAAGKLLRCRLLPPRPATAAAAGLAVLPLAGPPPIMRCAISAVMPDSCCETSAVAELAAAAGAFSPPSSGSPRKTNCLSSLSEFAVVAAVGWASVQEAESLGRPRQGLAAFQGLNALLESVQQHK